MNDVVSISARFCAGGGQRRGKRWIGSPRGQAVELKGDGQRETESVAFHHSTENLTMEEFISAIAENSSASESEIENAKEDLEEFDLPSDEIKRQLRNDFVEDDKEEDLVDALRDVDFTSLGGITGADQWGDVTVAFAQEWDVNHDAINQKGLVVDEHGQTMVLTVFNGATGEMKEGETYDLGNVVSEVYQGDYQLKAVSGSTLAPSNQSINTDKADEPDVTLTGHIVDVSTGTGFITRCSHGDCSRTLNSGHCSEHGNVSGEPDLRIKARFVSDDGEGSLAYFGTEAASEVLAMSIEEAENRVRDALDKGALEDPSADALVGHRLTIEADEYQGRLFVDSFDIHSPDVEEEAKNLLTA